MKNEKKWLREPDHDEGDDPQPSTQYVQLNAPILKELIVAWGVRPLPTIKKLRKEASFEGSLIHRYRMGRPN